MSAMAPLTIAAASYAAPTAVTIATCIPTSAISTTEKLSILVMGAAKTISALAGKPLNTKSSNNKSRQIYRASCFKRIDPWEQLWQCNFIDHSLINNWYPSHKIKGMFNVPQALLNSVNTELEKAAIVKD